ncbi:MAG: DegT/DnrJ/EryC1/StrS family aminotransferase [Flavobacteriales bacterium]|nr:DegT/DnrJ/EryC1/StrS family aminotransferase [Flavobacteriales bacterium]
MSKKTIDIKFVDLSRQYEGISEEIDNAIRDVLQRGDYILGEAVGKFEAQFSRYIGCDYSVGVSSGTDALNLAIKALDIGTGDEVITVPNTFVSTAYAISEAGAHPVFVDVDEATQLMDPSLLEDRITERTKAIIPVHLFGQIADMSAISDIATKYDLHIVEDACQAHGATQNDKKAGSMGKLGCFSFYPSKNLGALGDAGMITTSDRELYEKLILLRNYGAQTKNHHVVRGYNARLDNLQAAVLNVKLKYLESWKARRNEIHKAYVTALTGVGDLKLPTTVPGNISACHLFVIRTNSREGLADFLTSKRVPTIIHYPVPIHLQDVYRNLKLKEGAYPVAEMLANDILSLPIHPEMTYEEVDWVSSQVQNYFN